MNIFVAKLSPAVTAQDLQSLFEKYGEVASAKVIMDKATGFSKRYGFVEMNNEDEAKLAIQELNNSQFENSVIVVKQSLPKDEYDQQRKPMRPRE